MTSAASWNLHISSLPRPERNQIFRPISQPTSYCCLYHHYTPLPIRSTWTPGCCKSNCRMALCFWRAAIYRRPPYIGDNKFEAKAPEIPSRLRTSDSISKLLPSKVKPVHSGSKLPPKSFSQAPISKRIWKLIATATAALIMVGIPGLVEPSCSEVDC